MGKVSFREQCVIFTQGEKSYEAYLVESGKVGLYINYKKANERLLEVVEEGGVFGEMAMLERLPRSAAAVAITDCTLISFDIENMLALFQSHPQVALKLITNLSERLRKTTSDFDEANRLLYEIGKIKREQNSYLRLTEEQNNALRLRAKNYTERQYNL